MPKSRILVVITAIIGPGALSNKILLARVGSTTVRMEIGTDRSCVYTVPAVSEYFPFFILRKHSDNSFYSTRSHRSRIQAGPRTI